MNYLPANFAGLIEDFTDTFPARDWNYDLRLLQSLLAIAAALIVSLVIIKISNKYLPKLAEKITDKAASQSQKDQLLAVRRTETLLNVAAALGRFILIIASVYIAWRLVNPGSAPIAIIGAGTLFFVIGYATITPLLTDITSGIIMITEKWYEVGDYIVVDPFTGLSGVVEQINLRATKLRSLSGEIIHIHNKNISAVRVTPRGLRTISIDIFVNDLERGRALVEKVSATLPDGPAMIASPIRITADQKLDEGYWHITAAGQTSPGREWLIEEFAVKAISKADESQGDSSVLVYDPITRYTDEAAERRFLRSIKGKLPKSVNNNTEHKDYISTVEEL